MKLYFNLAVNETSPRKPVKRQNVSEFAMHRCNVCEYETNKMSHLKRHHVSAQEGVEGLDPKKGAQYSCDKCDYLTLRQESLKQHQLSKHEGVVVSCDKCELQTSTKYYFNQHELKVHVNGVIPVCETKEYLGKHVKNVHQTARFRCSFCDKKWTSKAQLQENGACYKDDFNFKRK